MPEAVSSRVPTSFTWDFENGFHVDNLEQYLDGENVYSSDDAESLVLQFQTFSDELEQLIGQVETGEDAEELMKIYNRLVKANNHILQYVSSDELKTGFHMNEMKLPDRLTAIRKAFSDVMGLNGDRNPTRGDLMKRLKQKAQATTAAE